MTAEKYLILDNRSVVGNCATWWAPDGRGYVCNIDDAGRYTYEQAHSQRDTDIPVPESLVLALAVRHVRADHLRDYIDLSTGNSSAESRMEGMKRVVEAPVTATSSAGRLRELEAEVVRLRDAAGSVKQAMRMARVAMIAWAERDNDNRIPKDARHAFNDLSILLGASLCDVNGKPAELAGRTGACSDKPMTPHAWLTIVERSVKYWKCARCGAAGGSAEEGGLDMRDRPFISGLRTAVSLDCPTAFDQIELAARSRP